MYNVSNIFKRYVMQPDREFEIRATIGAKTYVDTEVVEFDIEDSLISSEEFTLGEVIASKLTISVRTSDNIPSNAKITPEVRLNGIDGPTEWMPLGSYYIDSRTYQNTVWKFTAFDRLILSNQTYVSALEYPATMAAVMTEICGQLGITLDTSVVINPAYMVPYRDEDITIHDMLGYIASAHAASVRMTKDEKLGWVKFQTANEPILVTAYDYYKAEQTNPIKVYTRIVVTYNQDGEFLEVGAGDEEHTLHIYNPFLESQESIVNTLYATLNGFNYIPFFMEWRGIPFMEVGDAVGIVLMNGTTLGSNILTNTMSFKGGMKASSTAPSQSAQKSEFDYKGSLTQQVKKAVKTDQAYYGVTIGRANGLKIERADKKSKATFNSDKLAMSQGDGSGNYTDTLYFDVNGILNLLGAIINSSTDPNNANHIVIKDTFLEFYNAGGTVPKLKIGFQDETTNDEPIMVMGIGNGIGERGKGFFGKDTLGQFLKYVTSFGKEQVLRNDDAGITVSGTPGVGKSLRNTIVSTSNPASNDGSEGDIWHVIEG